jgi:hypothetical protein
MRAGPCASLSPSGDDDGSSMMVVMPHFTTERLIFDHARAPGFRAAGRLLALIPRRV